jgi:hypothetical protein
MDIIDLHAFLIKKIPNFSDPEILKSQGECYHYTPHWSKIQQSNIFKGAKINEDLDQTQKIHYLGEATEIEGVVFAYESLEDAREEGFGLDIIKISYKTAIKALHKAEDELGELTIQAALKLGIEMPKNETPRTLLILTTDIISFEHVEKA